MPLLDDARGFREEAESEVALTPVEQAVLGSLRSIGCTASLPGVAPRA